MSGLRENDVPIFKGRNSNAKRISALKDNSWDEPISAGQELTGRVEDITLYPNVGVAVKTDQPGTLYMEQSPDGDNWDISRDYQISANVSFQKINFVSHKFYRTRFISTSATAHTFFRLQTSYATYAETGSAGAGVASDLKRLCWADDADWNKGTVPATLEVFGMGDPAVVRTKAKINSNSNIPFTTAGNYTLSNGTLVEVAAGLARLSVQSGDSADFPFDSGLNYTFNSSLIEVTGGVSKLIHDPNIVGAWDLNESSGSNAPDTSDSGNDGTLTNMDDTDWVSAKLNNGLQFDGSNDYVTMGDATELKFERTDSFSLECWMKKNGTGSTEVLIAKQQQGGDARGYMLFIDTLGKLNFLLNNTGGNTLRVAANGTAVTDNAWRHIVVTYAGTSTPAGCKIYINNVSQTLTTVNDTLSATINSTANFQLAGRSGSNLPYGGALDAVKVWDKVLTAGEVTTQYNSGTGTEDMGYDQTDPTIVNNTGLSFSTALNTFTETATIPTGAGLRYHVSSDNGVTWEYWTGAAWAVTDDTFAQANTAADIQTNIGTLAASGTFKFRALLDSDGIVTPELSRVQVAGPNVFSTTDDLYVETKDASQINPTDLVAWLSVAFISTIPASTDIRILFSVDDRVSWLTWNGSAWAAPTSDTARTDATSLADAVTNFASLPATKPLDVRVFLNTSDASVTPSLDNIAVTSDGGFETTGVYTTNQFNSTVVDNDWDITTFINQIGSGGTVVIKARSANSIAELNAEAYGPAITNGSDASVIGQYIQFQITITGDGTEATGINQLCVDYEDPVREIVSP